MRTTDQQAELVAAFVRGFNTAWMEERYEDLRTCLHPDIVAVGPHGAVVRGLPAVIGRYRSFKEQSTVHSFITTELSVIPYPQTAVCHLEFEIDYTVGDRRCNEIGLEIYVVALNPNYQVLHKTQLLLSTLPV